ncbi:MAG: hypothetical protein Q9210_000083 [Variospora velana]
MSAGMLLAMFITWETEGSPHYVSMEPNQNIAYISDIGAQGLQPLFIAGCTVMCVFLDLSFAAERWLRHTGRLAKNMGIAEKVLSGLSIIFAIGGTCGLVLLSIFDTVRHPKLHDGFLLLFIAGYVISAIFICAEYQRLGVHFRQHRILRASFWMKLFFIIIEIFLAAVFIGTGYTGHTSIAAVFEWIIALIFTFYVFTFFVDLLPASRDHQKLTNLEVGHVDGAMRERSGNGYAVDGGRRFDGATDGIQTGQRPKPPVAQNY